MTTARLRPVRGWKTLTAFSLVVLTLPLLGAADPLPPVFVPNIQYGQRDGQPLLLDAYYDATASERPVLILIHGGSWRRRAKESWSELAPRYVAAGYSVVAINYSLAPPGGGTRFPTPIGDIEQALAWVRSHAADIGGDPQRVGMVGASAGGHLSLLAGGHAGDRPEAIAAFSPPVKLKRLHRQRILAGAIENFIGCDPLTCSATYSEASTTSAVDPGTPPTFLANSWDELIPVGQGLRHADVLTDTQIPHELVLISGQAHGMRVAKRTFDATVVFLNTYL